MHGQVLLFVLACIEVAHGSVCIDSDCHDASGAFVQRSRSAEHAIRPPKRVKGAKVSHQGTVNLLLAEMNDFITAKGQSGIDGDEIAHIHGIKALIDETILPTILEGVEESRAELASLMDDIKACEAHAVGVVNSTMIREEDVDAWKKTTRECVLKDDILKKDYIKECTKVNKSRLVIYLPGEEDFPPPNVPDEEMIKYLHIMDDFYCGRYEVFEEKVETCKDVEKNYTITHQECLYREKEFEEVSCRWKTHLDKSCEYFDTCWTDAVKAYNERKKHILELQDDRIGEYEGATKIECLWKAWIYEELPCTVNETQIRICHEYPPNYTNITIEFPPPPPPPTCSTASVELEICSDEWINIQFGDLGISRELIEDLRQNCIPCPTYTWTSEPEVTQHVHMYNARHITGSAYIKTSGKRGSCDAFVESDDPNVQHLTLQPASLTDKYLLAIISNSTSVELELEDSVATVEDGVTMYNSGDTLGIALSAGSALFTKNGAVFYSKDDIPADFTSGFGKVSLCGRAGTSLHSDFGLID